MQNQDAVIERYFGFLKNKLSNYLSPKFIHKYASMQTSEKITFLLQLKDILDKSTVLKIDFKEEYLPLKSLIKKIYDFLYLEHNQFGQDSYIKLLTILQESEFTSNFSATELSQMVMYAENKFIDDILSEANKFESVISDNQTKNRIASIRSSAKKSLIYAVFSVLFGLSIVGCNYFSEKTTDTKMENENKAETSKDSTKNYTITNASQKITREDWITRQNTPNMLVNAANYMLIGDTCGTWAIIDTLKNLKYTTKVNVRFSLKSAMHSISGNAEQTQERFDLLCSQAVNYTIQEYSKFTSLKIKKDLDSVNIIFEFNPDRNLLGYYYEGDPKIKNNIYVNINRLKEYSLGSAPFMIFMIISHEIVHMLVENTYHQIDIQDVKKVQVASIPDLLNKVQEPIDSVKVLKKIEEYRQRKLLTEREAFEFESHLMKILFSNMANDGTLSKSYLEYVLKVSPDGSVLQLVTESIKEMLVFRGGMNIQIKNITQETYNDLNARIELMKKELLSQKDFVWHVKR